MALSFRQKLVLFFLSLIVVIQLVALVAVNYATRDIALEQIERDLYEGATIFDREVASNLDVLTRSVGVAARDYGFREAVSTGDVGTIESVLENQSRRVGLDVKSEADVAVLFSPRGELIAQWSGNESSISEDGINDSDLIELVGGASELEGANGIVLIDDRPYQVAISPVRAPRLVAWLVIGFVADEPIVEQLKAVTTLDVSFAYVADSGGISVSSSTLDAATVSSLEREGVAASGVQLIRSDDDTYQTLARPLSSDVTVFLHSSVNTALEPFAALRTRLILLLVLALLASLLGASWVARGVTRPVVSLVEGAARLERGDYENEVPVTSSDELGKLAGAFNRMARGIAQREARIVHQATHDVLTELPNRYLMEDRLEHAIALARRQQKKVAVVMFDLAGFKEINDTLGHEVGDSLLQEIASRLGRATRESDTLARLGADEFSVVAQVSSEAEAREVAKRLLAETETPVIVGNVSLDVSARTGVALFPEHGDSPGTLIRRGDIALSDARANGSMVELYQEGRDDGRLERLALMSDLRRAVSDEQFLLHYQPKIEVATGIVKGMEALVRWQHPKMGLVFPDQFIPLAEKSGTISLLSDWVLREAMEKGASWAGLGKPLGVAVNLSPLDLNEGLPSKLARLLDETRLASELLTLEVTESVVMRDPAAGSRLLGQVRDLGVGISIDDFGTGHSSLAQLKRLPANELKIDKSFVMYMETDEDRSIVEAMIGLGHTLGMSVTAEGIENESVWHTLRDLGCDLGQGYHFTRPLDEKGIERWLADGGNRVGAEIS